MAGSIIGKQFANCEQLANGKRAELSGQLLQNVSNLCHRHYAAGERTGIAVMQQVQLKQFSYD